MRLKEDAESPRHTAEWNVFAKWALLAIICIWASWFFFYYWFAYKVTILGNLSLLFSPQPWYFCFVVFQNENHHSVQIMTLISKLKKKTSEPTEYFIAI